MPTYYSEERMKELGCLPPEEAKALIAALLNIQELAADTPEPDDTDHALDMIFATAESALVKVQR